VNGNHHSLLVASDITVTLVHVVALYRWQTRLLCTAQLWLM